LSRFRLFFELRGEAFFELGWEGVNIELNLNFAITVSLTGLNPKTLAIGAAPNQTWRSAWGRILIRGSRLLDWQGGRQKKVRSGARSLARANALSALIARRVFTFAHARPRGPSRPLAPPSATRRELRFLVDSKEALVVREQARWRLAPAEFCAALRKLSRLLQDCRIASAGVRPNQRRSPDPSVVFLLGFPCLLGMVPRCVLHVPLPLVPRPPSGSTHSAFARKKIAALFVMFNFPFFTCSEKSPREAPHLLRP
jgi:hypothetical protein